MPHTPTFLALFAALMVAPLASAQSIAVTSTADGGAGSFRQAIEDANASAGADTITFDPSVFSPGSGTTISLAIDLPEIDGTQGIVIDGTEAGVVIDGIGGSTSAGLLFGPFAGALSNLVVRNLALRDVNAGIRMSAQTVSEVVVDGVTVTDASGSSPSGVYLFGNVSVTDILIENASVAIAGGAGINVYSLEQTRAVTLRNTTATGSSDGFNIGSNGLVDGIAFEGTSSSGNSDNGYDLFGGGGIQNVTANDTAANDNAVNGWAITSSAHITGLQFLDSEANANAQSGLNASSSGAMSDWLIEGNTISGNGGNGLTLFAAEEATEVTIANNALTENGTTEAHSGVNFGGGAGDLPNVILGNDISGTTGTGILVYEGRVTISQNRTHGNGLLGVDLRTTNEPPPYVTPNDPGDEDAGPNNLQNFPELAAATGDGTATLTIAYTVPTATANATYPLRVEFFLADADDEEGKAYLGSDTYEAADAEQEAGIAFVPAHPVLDSDRVLATATDADGNTSEFGAAVTVVGSAVTSEPGVEAAAGFTLSAAYPNPFNPSTTLALDVPESGRVAVTVYDALGREVVRLHDGLLAVGTHTLRFEATSLPSGVYVVRASGPSGAASQRVTLLH